MLGGEMIEYFEKVIRPLYEKLGDMLATHIPIKQGVSVAYAIDVNTSPASFSYYNKQITIHKYCGKKGHKRYQVNTEAGPWCDICKRWVNHE